MSRKPALGVLLAGRYRSGPAAGTSPPGTSVRSTSSCSPSPCSRFEEVDGPTLVAGVLAAALLVTVALPTAVSARAASRAWCSADR